MRITRKEKVFIVVSLVTVFLIWYYRFFYRDLLMETKKIKGEIQIGKDKLERFRYSKEGIQDLKDEIMELESILGSLPSYHNNYDVEPQIIIFLDRSIQGLGINTYVKVGEIEEYKECYVIPVSINFKSGYNNIQRIIFNIEEAPWPYIVDNIKTSSLGYGGSDLTQEWEVEIVLRFFASRLQN